MNTEVKNKVKKRLVALSLVGVMLTTSGCSNKKKEEMPTVTTINNAYNNFDNYYKYVVINNEAIKKYKAENIFLLVNKETYEVSYYVYDSQKLLGGLGISVELYDLESGSLLVYSDGIATSMNKEYYIYLLNSNYDINFNNLKDYVEDAQIKDWYSLEEIKANESRIIEALKIINNAKVKTK